MSPTHDPLFWSIKDWPSGLMHSISIFFFRVYALVTLYFCLDDFAPVMRSWSYVPRIGDTIALPELGGNLQRLKVYEVVCDGCDEPIISIYLHRVRREHDRSGFAGEVAS